MPESHNDDRQHNQQKWSWRHNSFGTLFDDVKITSCKIFDGDPNKKNAYSQEKDQLNQFFSQISFH